MQRECLVGKRQHVSVSCQLILIIYSLNACTYIITGLYDHEIIPMQPLSVFPLNKLPMV